jgi:hypothetical protein
MDYHALGLGEAASVVTAVSIDKGEHTIIIACLYDPQDTQMPYTLCFKQCTHIVWQPFETSMDLHKLDAELIDISFGTNGTQQQACLTTDMFELSFVYEGFFLQTPASASYSPRTSTARPSRRDKR